MCMFSQAVDRVSDTRIFGRVSAGLQQLVYEMRVASVHDLAMVLPLPIAQIPSERAFRFIDLHAYPEFFSDLDSCFLKPQALSTGPISGGMMRGLLEVEQIGAYDASFVPTLQDFDRLDPRFRLPPEVWSQVPHYRNYGFAVFKIRKGDTRAHPMAMAFETRDSARLFFPTLHVHDGTLHQKAHFNHELFAQGSASAFEDWESAVDQVKEVMKLKTAFREDQSKGIIDAEARVFKYVIRGRQKNQDTWVAL